VEEKSPPLPPPSSAEVPTRCSSKRSASASTSSSATSGHHALEPLQRVVRLAVGALHGRAADAVLGQRRDARAQQRQARRPDPRGDAVRRGRGDGEDVADVAQRAVVVAHACSAVSSRSGHAHGPCSASRRRRNPTCSGAR
jgi:hypothetical protein